ncbi:MAG: hypothetical protein MUE42_01720 [Opitutaceae bacterium]|jgi:hypothetical protein|nr:hypothetical protein [Opitutaceae bacterium]
MISPRLLLAFAALFSASPVFAQVAYPRAGEAYVQTFDILAANSTLAQPWTDNVTIPGWFAALYDGSLGGHSAPDNILPTTGPGRLDSAFYFYRSHTLTTSKTPPDAALGSQPTDQRCPGVNSGGIFYGVALVNRTDATLDTLRVAYRVELWRLTVTPAIQNTLTASYRIGGDDLVNGIWTLLPGATYSTPQAGPGETGSARSLDGNASENTTPFDITVRGLALAPGETLWLRWFDVNNRGADHGIGLDDVAITLLP